jgi:Zn-dependent protease with chaperone function
MIIFIILFIGICERSQIKATYEGLINRRKKQEIKDIEDQKILDLVYKKTGVKLSKIRVYKTDVVWAMMSGFPSRPYMILSEDVLKRFNKDELEWVLLHESGHHVLWHNVKLVLFHIIFLLFGIWVLLNIPSLYLSILVAPVLSVLLAVLYFQLARQLEREANSYALKRMDNPKATITIAEKAKQRWFRKGVPLKSLKQFLFNIWIYDLYLEQADKAKKLV